MNRTETRLLGQIERGLMRDDAEFVQRMTVRTPLSTWYKVRFAVLSYVGLMMVMMYSVNIGLAVAGYAVLLTATIDIVRRFLTSSDDGNGSIVRSDHGLLASKLD